MTYNEAWTALRGYRREDGRMGVRNRIIVMAAADNVNPLVYALAGSTPEVTCIPATFGRGQLGPDLEQTLRTQAGIAAHPNVAEALIISFELESALRIADRVRAMGRKATCLSLLDMGGHHATLAAGREILEEMRARAFGLLPEPMPVSSLVIGLECGGSDATSGLVANPVVGLLSDELIAAGATTVFSEPVELIGCEPILDARASDDRTAADVRRLTQHYADIAAAAGVDLVGINPTADNIAGGLSTIEEKSLGAVAKSGSAELAGVIDYGERPPTSGLWLMDAPAAAVENLTALGAGGCHAILFTSGSVNPSGNPIAPTLKICANPDSCSSMREHVDVDLAAVLVDGMSMSQAVDCLREELLKVLDRKEPRADELGYLETRISRIGPSV